MEKKNYYIVFHGAKKNVGDYLIKESAIALISHYHPEKKLIELPNWEDHSDKLDLLNGADALIFMGGPGIQANTYPKVYPFVKDLNSIKKPVYILGSGSYMFPYWEKEIQSFRFDESTKRFLNFCSGISTRDSFTVELLERKGINKAVVTGCPAWYKLDKINTPFQYPQKIKNILISTPQKKIYWDQLLTVLDEVKVLFKDANIVVAFNRGIEADQHTSAREAQRLKEYKTKIERRNVKVVNVAYDLEKFKKFDSFDLHIGYRLHSHIFFLSNRKISYVIAEDSRSYGNYSTLSLPGFPGVLPGKLNGFIPYLKEGLFKTLLFKILPPFSVDSKLGWKLRNRIRFDQKSNFAAFNNIHSKIDENLNIMSSFIKEIP